MPAKAPRLEPAYRHGLGRVYNTSIEDYLASSRAAALRGKVQLILTSPPFPLAAPKAYGNHNGEEYLNWLVGLFSTMKELLTSTGSLVIEIGNAWDKGSPTMSTLPLRTLLAIAERADLHLCQQFVWENPAKLPGPAPWVTRKRIRVKDSHTNIWWLANSPYPDASNTRVLTDYKAAQRRLMRTGKYNSGVRPSEHVISESGFAKDNGGAIPGSVLRISNTASDPNYRSWCAGRGLPQHPARMPIQLAEFFIRLASEEGDLIFDPFGGSNVTGRAAQNLRRRWEVTELDASYVEGSRGRFQRED